MPDPAQCCIRQNLDGSCDTRAPRWPFLCASRAAGVRSRALAGPRLVYYMLPRIILIAQLPRSEEWRVGWSIVGVVRCEIKVYLPCCGIVSAKFEIFREGDGVMMLCVGCIVAWFVGLWEILRWRRVVGGIFRGGFGQGWHAQLC